MAQQRSGELSRWKRFVPGIVVTVFMVLVSLSGDRLGGLELRFQDLLLWKTRPAETAAPEITVIEIDDAALRRIEKWPWSWDKMAAIIDALADLDASGIVLDIIYTEEPSEIQKYRIGEDALAEYPGGTPLNDAATIIRIEPRDVLADSIRRSGRTILTYSLSTQSMVNDPLYEAIEAALVAELSLSNREVAQRLGVPEKSAGRFFLTARRRAMEILLGRRPAIDPTDPKAVGTLFADLFPGKRYDDAGWLKVDFDEALDYCRRERQLLTSGKIGGPARSAVAFPTTQRVRAPLAELSGAAAATGFATFAPDPDGTVRRVPLLMVHHGETPLPQLGLRAAMFARGARTFSYSAGGGTIGIVGDNGSHVTIPVDEKGQMIVSWSKGRDRSKDGFRHLPITKVHQYALLLKNRRIYDQAMAFAAEADGKTQPHRDLLKQLAEAHREGKPEAERQALRKKLRSLEGRFLMAMVKGMRTMALPQRQRAMAYAAFLQQYGDEADRIDEQLAAVAEQLRDAVEGRLCFVGMTATSATLDLKPTPIHRDYPGVFAHATVADNVLRRRFAQRAHWLMRAALLILVGLAVTLVSGWLPAFRAAAASLAIMAAYFGLCWLLFVYRGLIFLMVWPLVVGTVSLLAIMIYRELTEGNRRRWITDRFKQYTSEKMVDELVANPDFLVLGGQRRDMTVYFSDIAGFTSLSERLEAPQLVSFLQMYLEEMTDRLLEQDATLDKYEGDAVMAFFGAPLAQKDHAARCLRAALEHLRALPRLNKRFHAEGLLPEDRDLRVRIGISSGQMAVGNFGSRRRFDYTVIGDTVNLGARLEGVNRTFGTTVLFSGATRQQVGDEFLVRPIGPVRVVGRSEPIDVFELLDPEVPNAKVGLEDYLVALEDFQGGWLNEARQKFEQVLQARPDDGPTLAYLRRVDALLRDGIQGNPGPWDMTEK
jgi:adenylate cyclase